jgi:hypothetical protein
MLSMNVIKKNVLCISCVVIIVFSFSCGNGNQKPKQNDMVSLQQDAGVELFALRLWKAIQQNDFETFKQGFVNIDELKNSIKKSNIESETKERILDELMFMYDEVNEVVLNKVSFDKYRSRIQAKYGGDFWEQVQLLESSPIIINNNDSLKNTTEANVSYKLLYNNDTIYVHFNTFFLQQTGWRFLGNVNFSKNESDERIYDFEVNDFAKPNQDSSKGIERFEDAFEKEEPTDE